MKKRIFIFILIMVAFCLLVSNLYLTVNSSNDIMHIFILDFSIMCKMELPRFTIEIVLITIILYAYIMTDIMDMILMISNKYVQIRCLGYKHYMRYMIVSFLRRIGIFVFIYFVILICFFRYNGDYVMLIVFFIKNILSLNLISLLFCLTCLYIKSNFSIYLFYLVLLIMIDIGFGTSFISYNVDKNIGYIVGIIGMNYILYKLIVKFYRTKYIK